MKVKRKCLASALPVIGSANAQWENPVDRYANEYKKHISVTCPLPGSGIKHFVYFARDRQSIQGGNYIGQTNNTEIVGERQNILPALHSFADSGTDSINTNKALM